MDLNFGSGIARLGKLILTYFIILYTTKQSKTLHTTTKQLKSKPYASKQKQIKYKRT